MFANAYRIAGINTNSEVKSNTFNSGGMILFIALKNDLFSCFRSIISIMLVKAIQVWG